MKNWSCLNKEKSAVWALRFCNSIEEGIVKIACEGGDTDINGAVVGAVLGAKFGFKKIPSELIDLIFVRLCKFRETEPFIKVMGIDMPTSPYT